MKAAGGLYRVILEPFTWAARSWVTAGTIAITYFLAAQLGLALLSQPTDVAVFWPASGVAAGILIIFGRQVRPALVIGVVVGTFAANLMSDRSLWTSTFKGFCNAGEAVLVAWLIERWFDRPFTFGDLRRVLGFVAAAGIATAASAVGGAATMTLFHTAAPFWEVWRTWFLSDGVGIVAVAPLIIGLGQVWRELPSRGEWIEGVGVLALLALISFYVVTHPTGSWLSFSPGALVLPLLLWLTARCQPTFGITGAFVASITVIYATTFGLGRFGDAAIPMMERVKGAQAAVITVTLYTLALVALFAQRKKAEEGLRESEGRLARKSAALTRLHEVGSRLWLKRDLRQALDEILAGAIELLGADMGNIRILDSTRRMLKIGAQRGFKKDFLDSFGEVSAAGDSPCGRALRSGERMVIEDVEADKLFTPFRPLARSAGFRAVQSTPITSREGALLGTLATHFRSVHKPGEEDLRLLDLYVRQAADIIERHDAEDALRESEERLRLAQLRTGIGIWDWNLRTGKLTWTPELEAIFGLEPGSVKCHADFRDRIHPDDIEAFEASRNAAVRRRETFNLEFRVFRADGQIRLILAVGGAFYNEATGEPIRILGNIADITDRKLAELALAERNLQLALAGRASLVGSYAYDADTQMLQVSEGYAAVHGFPEGTTAIPRSQWLAGVHPEDAEMLERRRGQAFRQRQVEYSVDYRIFLAGRGLRWIEARSFISYDGDGHPQRVVGVIIDVTERKLAELALAERNLQFALAGKAGLVGSYVYDVTTDKMQISEGYAAIHGLPEGTTETTLSQWKARVHPEDLERMNELRGQAFAELRKESNAEYRILRLDHEVRWIERRSSISHDSDGRPQRVVGVIIDVTERKQAEEHRNILNAELDHRVKNVLATVCAIIFQSQRAKASAADFVASVDHRIKSLASTHELLSHSRWHGVSLSEIIRREFSPYTTGNTEFSGPSIILKPEAAQATAMVLHELATNAAKYGALSNHSGRVSVRWFWPPNGVPHHRLALEWQEIGGPPVSAPIAFGYGTSIIRELIPYELGGTVDLAFAAGGVRCRLEVPAHCVSGDRRSKASSASTNASLH